MSWLQRIIAYVLMAPIPIACTLWTALATWVAFVGGKIPLLPIHFYGVNIIRGAAWFMIVDPIIFGMVSFCLSVLIALITLPIQAISLLFKKTARK